MIRKSTDSIKDEETRQHLDFIHQEALGKVIELDAAPTADAPLIQDREIGEYGDELYFRIGNTILVVTPSSTITVI